MKSKTNQKDVTILSINIKNNICFSLRMTKGWGRNIEKNNTT